MSNLLTKIWLKVPTGIRETLIAEIILLVLFSGIASALLKWAGANPLQFAAFLCLGLLWISCAYLAFGKRPVKVFQSGMTVRKPFGKRIKQSAFAVFVASLIIAPLTWHGYKVATAPPVDDRVLVLVAEFQDTQNADSLGVTRQILQELEEVADDYGDELVVKPFSTATDEVVRDNDWFREQGEELGAEIVMWGDYVTVGEQTKLAVNFEVLSVSNRLALSESRQSMEFATLESFDIMAVLSNQTNYLTLLTLGLAQYEAGDYYGAIARLTEAANEAEESVEILEGTTAQGIEQVVGFEVVYFFLGKTYFETIKYEEAISAYRRAIEYQPEYPEALNNLGLTLIECGKYLDAQEVLEDARKTNIRLLGDKHPDVAISLNNLASLYRVQGRYEEAESLYIQALELMRELLGDKHPDVASSLNNLALLYRAQGRYEEAESLYIQALEMSQELLEAKHPDVATRLNNLALLYRAQGRYEEAEPLYIQALDMRKELLGAQHPDVASSLNNLALLYESQGRYEKAESLYIQALEMFQQLLGAKHPSVALSLNNLAGLY